ncbi:MAG: peptide chain release factor N(5)-glutamine methyltransferase [Pseudomonadota bacterium]
MKNLEYEKKTWKVNEVLKWTTNYLKDKGCQSPRLDAELLLAHALKTNRIGLYLIFDQPLSERERTIYRELVRRRASREPVAVLVGKKEFWSLDVIVRPGVLVPRPETEILLEVALEECKQSPGCSVLEVGCGSGAVICALLSEVTDITAYACDICPEALQNTRVNLEPLYNNERPLIFASDLFESVRNEPLFDVILSNPPYIPSGFIEQLEPEIRVFEPTCALDGGPDGLDIIRRLIKTSRTFLKPKGKLIIEIGEKQSQNVSNLFMINGFSTVKEYKDLSQKIRVLKGVI